jgi:hypothetical protein
LKNFKENLPYLDYNSSKRINSFITIHKELAAFLLRKDNLEVFLIAFNNTLSENGIDNGELTIEVDMTIEIIVNPTVQSSGRRF